MTGDAMLTADILVAAPEWQRLWPSAAPDIAAALAAVHGHLALAEGAEIALNLTCDAEMARLNAHFRGKEGPTNVLSFPAPEMPAAGAPRFLGDVALALETTEREAARDGRPLRNHALHLIVHGVLHLLGYDHDIDSAADIMEGHETAILARLALPDPYGGQGAARSG